MKRIFTFFVLLLCYGATFAQNRGLNFGGGDYVTVPESPSVASGSALTIEAWINPNATSYATVVFSKGQPTNSSYFAVFCSSANFSTTSAWNAGSFLNFDLFTTNGGNRLSYQLPSTIAGTWHHIAISYDGAEKRLYLDGALVGQQPLSGAILTDPGSPFLIGNLAPTYGNPYNGTIDELRIWNTVRTATEIAGNLNTEIAPTTPGLTAYYKFNQGIAGGNNTGITTATDAAVVPHDGTLNNFTLTGNTSNFVGGYPSLTVLPLRLSSFSAGKDGSVVNVQWKTSLQKDIVSFDIERSTDGQHYAKIGAVPARTTGGDEQSYQYTDKLPMPDINYYRLKATETSGKLIYSKAVIIRMNTAVTLGVYPNPATDVVQLQTTQRGNFTVRIQDASQRIVKTLQLTSNGTSLVTPVDVSTWQKGIYFIHVGETVLKFVKQ